MAAFKVLKAAATQTTGATKQFILIHKFSGSVTVNAGQSNALCFAFTRGEGLMLFFEFTFSSAIMG